MFLAIIVFIIIFSILVLTHEWGHYYTAKRMGIKVDEFGMGLPPRIWGFKKNGTIFSFNWIPFGGFVKIYGENEEIKGDKSAFSNKTVWQRMLVISAGVLTNLFVGFLVLMIGFWFAMPPLVTPPEYYASNPDDIVSKIVVLKVEENSPAEVAGVLLGDYIIGANEVAFNSANDLPNFLIDKQNQSVILNIERGKDTINLAIIPMIIDENVVIGVWTDREVEAVSYIWWKVPWFALVETFKLISVIVIAIGGFLYQLFSTASVSTDFAGPVGIANIVVDLLSLGWIRILQFMAFISINLGLINLVPFPALDGGRLLFIILEILRGGKKVSAKIEAATHTMGFLLLMVLILVITYRDIIKLF